MARASKTLAGLCILAAVPLAFADEGRLVRDHHEMVFDRAAGRVLIFGGNSRDAANEYNYVADTRALDGGTWTRLAADGPPPRSSFSMAYDAARNRTVLFGGYFEGRALDDTWVFDGKRWGQAETQGPSGRMSPAMAYDPQSKVVLLFGGQGDGLYGDTWIWNGETWIERYAQGPPPRSRMAMFHDARRKSIVLHGGYVRVEGRGQSAADMWEWKDGVWTEVDQGPLTPPPLRGHRVAYDQRRNVAVLFGGSSEHGVYRDETWEWNGANWTEQTPEVRPPSRGNFSMAYDSKLERVVIQGGKGNAGQTLSDCWAWDGNVWAPVVPPPQSR